MRYEVRPTGARRRAARGPCPSDLAHLMGPGGLQPADMLLPESAPAIRNATTLAVERAPTAPVSFEHLANGTPKAATESRYVSSSTGDQFDSFNPYRGGA